MKMETGAKGGKKGGGGGGDGGGEASKVVRRRHLICKKKGFFPVFGKLIFFPFSIPFFKAFIYAKTQFALYGLQKQNIVQKGAHVQVHMLY